MVNANSNGKKKVVGMVAAVCAATMAVAGSLALFTDTASIKGATTAGKLAIGITADKMTEAGDFSEQLLNTAFDAANPVDNFNPGDDRTVAYTINNEQSKATYVNDTITLKVTPDTAYTADGQAITPENCAITFATADGVLTEKSRSMDNGVITIVYEGKETVLSGTGTNAEVVKEGVGNTANPTTAAPMNWILMSTPIMLGRAQKSKSPARLMLSSMQTTTVDWPTRPSPLSLLRPMLLARSTANRPGYPKSMRS